MDVSGSESPILQRTILHMNLGCQESVKLDMVKQEMARMNADILEISKLKKMSFSP